MIKNSLFKHKSGNEALSKPIMWLFYLIIFAVLVAILVLFIAPNVWKSINFITG